MVLIAASHQETFAGVSIWPGTPLGDIAIDRILAERLVAADDSIRFALAGYGAEHSLEVQLPFLQTVLPGVPVVPLMVGMQSLDLVWSNDPFLLGYRSFTGELEACGAGAVVTVLEAARRLGASRTQVLAYAHSGWVTGDTASVVGYAAVTVAEGPAGSDPLTPREKELLVEIARGSVAAGVRREALPPMPPSTPSLMRKQAAFVTLRDGNEMRGCVGVAFAAQPLAEQVRASAVAASRDERFLPLSPAELPRLDYEISLLSPLTPLDEPGSLVIGRDGVMLVSTESVR